MGLSMGLKSRRIVRRALLVSLLVGTASGCVLLAPHFETPRLSLVSIDFERGGLLEQQLRARMRVQNPNDRSLPVHGLEYTLYVQDEEVAHGVSVQSFTVPALGEAEFDTELTTHLAGMLVGLLGHSAPNVIDYRIIGKVELSAGWLRSVPFEHRGEVRLR